MNASTDTTALEQLVEDGDPLVYDVHRRDVPEETGGAVCCAAAPHPGGAEGGHPAGRYHADRDTGEVYVGLGGGAPGRSGAR